MRARRLSRRGLAGAGVVLFIAVVLGVTLAPDLRADASRGLPPTALNRIAQKNDNAAALAAARMRDRSEASAQRADAMRAAEERGREKAQAVIGRFDNDEAGLARSEAAR